jgi:hypothetical protein
MAINRESKRVAIDLKGDYRIWESDFPYAVITVVNISHTGICFRTDNSVDSGSSVELRITLPTGKPVNLLGKVIWSNPLFETKEFNTGVKIMNVNSQDAKQFVHFYQSQLLYPPSE